MDDEHDSLPIFGEQQTRHNNTTSTSSGDKDEQVGVADMIASCLAIPVSNAVADHSFVLAGWINKS